MDVFKFGGASVSTIDRIYKVSDILKAHEGKKYSLLFPQWAKPPMHLKK